MPINKDNTPLDFYVGDSSKVAKDQSATDGYVYLDKDNNNIFIGKDNKMQSANGVHKEGDNVIVDGNSLQLGSTTITSEQLANMVAVANLDLANGVYWLWD